MKSELARRKFDWDKHSLVDDRRRHIIKVLAGAGLVLGSGFAGKLAFAGLFGKPAGQIVTWLGEPGLSAPAGHVMLQPLLHQTNRVLDDALALGHRYLLIPLKCGVALIITSNL
ncbi:hypothetical protein [Arsukibacterium indicum]|uniref:Uncharacterized protein n=1 Tax=Arsukibacterium indicum TaxID=2848612 RepID=A0ABS6MQI6_9GAMM|nr:hypothetical protein [Arsukibacterium indicum]MBV2130830.1 hypothetical protein [Arsukibacterium indicum]